MKSSVTMETELISKIEAALSAVASFFSTSVVSDRFRVVFEYARVSRYDQKVSLSAAIVALALCIRLFQELTELLQIYSVSLASGESILPYSDDCSLSARENTSSLTSTDCNRLVSEDCSLSARENTSSLTSADCNRMELPAIGSVADTVESDSGSLSDRSGVSQLVGSTQRLPSAVSDARLGSAAYLCPLCSCTAKRPVELAAHLNRLHGQEECGADSCSRSGPRAVPGQEVLPSAPLYVCQLCRVCSDQLSHVQAHSCRYGAGDGDDIITRLLKSGGLIESVSTCFTELPPTSACRDKMDASAARRNRLICHQCSAEFRNVQIFTAHARYCEPGPYRCHVCATEWPSVPRLVSHKLSSHKDISDGLFLCCVPNCSATFRTYPAYLKHLMVRHPAPTGSDQQRFTPASPLRDAFTCQHCRKVFVKKIYLTHHQMRHHPHLLERKFICEVCGAQLGSSSALSVHVSSVHGSSRFRCHLCPRVFTRRDRLRHHCRLHSGEKPFRCCFCDKAFVQRCKLSEHVRRHRGEKRFRCPQCAKQYAANSDLRSHLRRIHNMDLFNRTHTIQPIAACLRPLSNDITEREPIRGDFCSPSQSLAIITPVDAQATPIAQFSASIVSDSVEQSGCSDVFAGGVDSPSTRNPVTPSQSQLVTIPAGDVPGSSASLILLHDAPTLSYPVFES